MTAGHATTSVTISIIAVWALINGLVSVTRSGTPSNDWEYLTNMPGISDRIVDGTPVTECSPDLYRSTARLTTQHSTGLHMEALLTTYKQLDKVLTEDTPLAIYSNGRGTSAIAFLMLGALCMGTSTSIMYLGLVFNALFSIGAIAIRGSTTVRCVCTISDGTHTPNTRRMDSISYM